MGGPGTGISIVATVSGTEIIPSTETGMAPGKFPLPAVGPGRGGQLLLRDEMRAWDINSFKPKSRLTPSLLKMSSFIATTASYAFAPTIVILYLMLAPSTVSTMSARSSPAATAAATAPCLPR